VILGNNIIQLNSFDIGFSLSYLFIGAFWNFGARVNENGDVLNRFIKITICIIPCITFEFIFEFKNLNNINSVQNISDL